MTNKLRTVDIKGKPYVLVNDRLKYFREKFPDFSLITKILSLDDGIVTMSAEIADQSGRVIAVGHAQEKESSSYINRTSFIENCETSAWGRALANFGIGIDESVASYDEVVAAIKAQEDIKQREGRIIKEAAESFQSTINGVPMANEAQISEIKMLLFALQQPEEAVLNANGAKKFEDFTEKAAENLIKKLKEKVG